MRHGENPVDRQIPREKGGGMGQVRQERREVEGDRGHREREQRPSVRDAERTNRKAE